MQRLLSALGGNPALQSVIIALTCQEQFKAVHSLKDIILRWMSKKCSSHIMLELTRPGGQGQWPMGQHLHNTHVRSQLLPVS